MESACGATSGGVGVVKAIAGVMADIAPIAKSRENKEQRFWYRSVDQVWDALNPLLAKHGLVIIPTGFSDKSEATWTTRNGAQAYRVAGMFHFRVIAGSDGSHLDGAIPAEAADYGDKALTKLCSMAYKQFAIQLFCIPLTSVDADEGNYDRQGSVEQQPPQSKPAAPKPQSKPAAVAPPPPKPAAPKPAEQPQQEKQEPAAEKPAEAAPPAEKKEQPQAEAAQANGSSRSYTTAMDFISKAGADDLKRARARVSASPVLSAEEKEKLIGLCDAREKLLSTEQ